ncbi:MAG TPA: adenylate cyclase [Candidatus Dormibacteraeota bacterium]|nr:adenylate cyclase [Candidatus Dormibacteraeota bacterium]
MRKLIAAALFAGLAAGATALPAAALVTPTTGQPGAPTNTCGPANPVTPGNSANSPGSPFNTNGQAGLVYAGNPGTASLAHSNSTATVSQYDAACVRLSH